MRNVTYVEPYAGGAGAALGLLLSSAVRKIVINDLDSSIYSFWRSLVLYPWRLISEVQKVPVTIREWNRQKAILDDPHAGLFQRGFATFYLNRTNVSGNMDGGPIGGFDQGGEWKIGARFYRETLIRRIETIAQKRDRITVLNEDGIDVIKKYVRWKSAFIYIDPPYYEKGATLYLNHYQDEDHERLASVLNRHPDALWALTYDDKRKIRKLYADRQKQKYPLNYRAYESRQGKEILIVSDAITLN